jgi:hypothetical protein
MFCQLLVPTFGFHRRNLGAPANRYETAFSAGTVNQYPEGRVQATKFADRDNRIGCTGLEQRVDTFGILTSTK